MCLCTPCADREHMLKLPQYQLCNPRAVATICRNEGMAERTEQSNRKVSSPKGTLLPQFNLQLMCSLCALRH